MSGMNETKHLADAKIPELGNEEAAKIIKKFRIVEETEEIENRWEGECGAVYNVCCYVL